MYVDKGVLVASASARRRVVVVGSSGGSTVQFPAPVEFLEALSSAIGAHQPRRRQSSRRSSSAASLAWDDATPRSPASLWIVCICFQNRASVPPRLSW